MSTCTLAQAQSLVSAIAAIAAPYLEQEMTMGPLIVRQYAAECIQPSSTTAPGSNAATATALTYTGPDPTAIHVTAQNGAAISPTSFVNTLIEVPGDAPCAEMLADQNFLNDTVRNLVKQLADNIDFNTLALYSSFSTNAPVGTGGSTITDAFILAAANSLDAYSSIPKTEPRYLVLCAGGTRSGGNNHTHDDFLALANLIDQTKVGTGTTNAGYLKRRVSFYRGLQVIPSNQITQTGSSPTFTHQIAFSRKAMILVIGNEADTNDATHVQQLSSGSIGGTATSAVHVRLAFNAASDVQRIALRVAYGVGIGINGFGTQFNT